MEWKRTGRHTAFILLVSFPIAAIGFAAVVLPSAQGRAVWAVRDRQFDSGPASRTKPLTTPAGRENVAAWAGRIGRLEGKNKSLRAYCTIAEVDGLVAGQRVLRVWDTPGTFALRETPPGDELTTFDFVGISCSELGLTCGANGSTSARTALSRSSSRRGESRWATSCVG